MQSFLFLPFLCLFLFLLLLMLLRRCETGNDIEELLSHLAILKLQFYFLLCRWFALLEDEDR